MSILKLKKWTFSTAVSLAQHPRTQADIRSRQTKQTNKRWRSLEFTGRQPLPLHEKYENMTI